MKSLQVYDDTHHAVKVAATESRRTVPNFTSALLGVALVLLKQGKLKLPEDSKPKPVATR